MATLSSDSVVFLHGLHKAAAKAKDKENLFVDETEFPDIVEQKNAIKSVEGRSLALLSLGG